MNKKISLLLIALSLPITSAISDVVYAESIKINLSGNIIVLPCDISSSTANLPVDLGHVDARELASKGEGSTPVNFNINLLNCPPGVQNVAVKFSGLADKYDPTLLALDKGGATGVGVEIQDSQGKKIPVNSASSLYSVISESISLPFSAHYVATGQPITAGAGNTSANFDIIYP